MGDKIFINFNKYPFEKCIELVFKEINLSINQINKDSDHAKSVPAKASVTRSFSKPIAQNSENQEFHSKHMNEAQVDKWFREKSISDGFKNILCPCNGEVLHQLFKMRNSAPEFYFQSISKNSNLELKSILLFSLELEKLFEN